MKQTLTLLALLFANGEAFGQTCTASIGDAVFGSVAPLTPGTYATTSTLAVTCSGFQSSDTIAICVDLGSGTGGSNGSSQRLLSGPSGASLAFQIFSDSGYSNPWGTVGSYGSSNIPLLSQTGNGTQQRTLYFTANTTVSSTTPGTYTSTFNPLVKYGKVSSTAGGCSAAALPGTAGAPFLAQASLSKSCLLNVTQNVNFGAHAAFTSNVDTTGGLNVQCTNNTPYDISLDLGAGGAATPSARKMKGPGGDTLVYGLYRDEARSSVWGNTLGSGSDAQPGNGNGAPAAYTVYGRIPPQSTPAAGSYSDMVVVTVTY